MDDSILHSGVWSQLGGPEAKKLGTILSEKQI